MFDINEYNMSLTAANTDIPLPHNLTHEIIWKDYMERITQSSRIFLKTNDSLEIKNVIFNNPATIVFWKNGTKTVVKADNEAFDPEKGLAMAIAKKALGNKGNYYNKIKKWLPVEYRTLNTNSTTIFKTTDEVHGLSAYTGYDEARAKKIIQTNKYGDGYDTRLFFAGKGHKIVCAGDCYHVKNIKKENALAYFSLEEALADGCRPCKHCHGKHKEEK